VTGSLVAFIGGVDTRKDIHTAAAVNAAGRTTWPNVASRIHLEYNASRDLAV